MWTQMMTKTEKFWAVRLLNWKRFRFLVARRESLSSLSQFLLFSIKKWIDRKSKVLVRIVFLKERTCKVERNTRGWKSWCILDFQWKFVVQWESLMRWFLRCDEKWEMRCLNPENAGVAVGDNHFFAKLCRINLSLKTFISVWNYSFVFP